MTTLSVLCWKWNIPSFVPMPTPSMVQQWAETLRKWEAAPRVPGRSYPKPIPPQPHPVAEPTLDSLSRVVKDRYTAEHVNRLARMVARHLHRDYRFFCITENPSGLEPGVTALPLPPDEKPMYRNCRRLRVFSEEMRPLLGDRILQLDLDTVITGDLTLLTRFREPLVIWSNQAIWSAVSRQTRPHGYNPSFMLVTTGAFHQMWASFLADPTRALLDAGARGGIIGNSDQCIVTDWIEQRQPEYRALDQRDGLYSFRDDLWQFGKRDLPDNARMVSFYDPKFDPALVDLQQDYPWITEHWR